MTDLVLALARALVEQSGRVRVTERTQGGELRLELTVAPGDRGRVIGRNGRTAAALRTLLAAVAKARGVRCTLEIRA